MDSCVISGTTAVSACRIVKAMAIDPTDVDALPVPVALQADPLEGTREHRIHLQGGEVAAE